MALIPHTVDIVVADMARAVAFYRLLGLDIPAEADGEGQVNCETAGGYGVSFVLEAIVRQGIPDWQAPVGQRVTLAFRAESPAEVDATYAAVEAAGFAGRRAPWDAFWGQRYAFLQDPDGNRVDLFAELG